MNSLIQSYMMKSLGVPFCLLVCLLMSFLQSEAQPEKPPRPISVMVYTAQHLSFGSFIPTGSTGSVTVNYNGVRSSTGSIILPNMYSIVTPALFIIDAEPGTLITIVNGPTATLTGSHGGMVNLQVGSSNVGNPFITRGQSTEVFIGGTLTIGPLESNPAGLYNGTFQVTFIQQ